MSGGEAGYRLHRVHDLSDASLDYRPYLLGRFYDIWEDYDSHADREPAPTQLIA